MAARLPVEFLRRLTNLALSPCHPVGLVRKNGALGPGGVRNIRSGANLSELLSHRAGAALVQTREIPIRGYARRPPVAPFECQTDVKSKNMIGDVFEELSLAFIDRSGGGRRIVRQSF